MLGGLGASGWHTCALLMRIIVDGFVLHSNSRGSPGVDEVKWLKPVRPGDRLTIHAKTLEKRASRSRPEMGFVSFRFELRNQAGESVMTLIFPLMVARRSPPQAKPGAAEHSET